MVYLNNFFVLVAWLSVLGGLFVNSIVGSHATLVGIFLMLVLILFELRKKV